MDGHSADDSQDFATDHFYPCPPDEEHSETLTDSKASAVMDDGLSVSRSEPRPKQSENEGGEPHGTWDESVWHTLA